MDPNVNVNSSIIVHGVNLLLPEISSKVAGLEISALILVAKKIQVGGDWLVGIAPTLRCGK